MSFIFTNLQFHKKSPYTCLEKQFLTLEPHSNQTAMFQAIRRDMSTSLLSSEMDDTLS